MTGSAGLRWAIVLGFALGGFFDGILLHQVLQWHHLLSLVPGAGDLGRQVLWDGLFHAIMYVLAGSGLWGLWRSARAGVMPTGTRLGGALLLGFGLWHLSDAVLSHMLLGLHRVRIDSESPLAWDVGWFVAFGLLPLILGWVLLGRGRDDRSGRGGATLAALALLSLGAGGWALRPTDAPYTLAVFAPGRSVMRIEQDLDALGAKVVWSGPTLRVALLDIPPERRWSLYARGALMVSGAALPSGCLGYSRVTEVSAGAATPSNGPA